KHIPLRSLRQLTFNKRHLSALRQAHTRRNHRTISRKIKLRRPIGPRRRHRERRPLRELTSLNTPKHLVCVSRWLDSRRWKDLGHEFIIEAEVQCPVQGRGGAVGAAVTEADRRGCR